MSVRSTPRASPGRSWPLGVTVETSGEPGVNVAVWAPDATRVWFCRFDDAGREERIELRHRDGGIRHARVSGVGPGDRYGFRAAGPFAPEAGMRFDASKLLIDPRATELDGPLRWDPLMEEPGADSAPVVPKCVVSGPPVGPDPARNRPGHARADLVIYEAHLAGLSAAHPEVPEELRGTYAGCAHPAVLAHLRELGVTAVEFLPLQAFFDDCALVHRGLTNYWGYQPIAWSAPEPRYAFAHADTEFRALVHALHEAGIAVIVDVVFNHTGEGDADGPTLSLRGLDNAGSYLLVADDAGQLRYADDTGTGNTIAAHRPEMLRLILDSLRHWAVRYGVDGFRFDLAATLGRTTHGFDAAAPFFQAIRQDPVLGGLILIAEPWDLGPGGYRLGEFPHPWSEWNDRFRDGVRRAWRGDPSSHGHPGRLSDLAALLLGSADRFDRGSRTATASVNFITAHDGFTLDDLVSYAHKHNEANGEDGRDGHDHNYSDNLGVEGPSDDPGIRERRELRAAALLATLLLAQGVPMLLAGDELGNSQHGNNNAYAQDNPVGWVDWAQPNLARRDLVRRLIALRRARPVLRQRAFRHGRSRADGERDIVWRQPDGTEPRPEDWQRDDWNCLGMELRGAAEDLDGEACPERLFVVVNLGDAQLVALPDPASGHAWRILLDTAEIVTGDGSRFADAGAALTVRSPSVVVLSEQPETDTAPGMTGPRERILP